MAGGMFLKLINPLVKGEATASGHEGEIQVLSWNHSFNQPTSPTRNGASGGTVEQASHSDFSFTKYTDASTDDLLKLCWSGKSIAKGIFCAYRPSGDGREVKYLEIVLETIIVSNVSIGGGTGDIPTETVTLSYGAVEYKYIPRREDDGPQRVKHDLVQQAVW
ncbi:type VI secretion system tube protein Hcp [Niveispirillum sp.]|uniref:Hcp family type VI secretion system effector n=1 Tax=Niveispirillum sp. TaxID=1917217 RepID=UPI001B58FC67|nr:type VI secretion system tube protein Hcp [Niveispirillum sp.]MBP7336158.1 type VI secretion system tube protein Hcp [Niveispirillum sp.]